MKINNNKEILIVEDSPTQAEMLKFVLEKHNYDVSVAKNGMEALSELDKCKPSMIISDVVMPEMDGYDLCRHIKGKDGTKDIPVILLTALSDPKDVVSGLGCGADNFVTKPFDEKYLISKIQYLFENKVLFETENMPMNIRIFLGGQEYNIVAGRQQILNLLVSTYETAVQKNIELHRTQDELRTLNEELERKVEERTVELKKSEERYRRLFEASKDGLLLLNGQTCEITNVNPAIVNLLGYNSQNFIGNRLYQMGLFKDMEYEENVMQRLKVEGFIHFDHVQVKNKNGQEVDTEIFLIDEAGAIQCNIRNITERKLMEEELRKHREHLEELVKERTAELNDKNVDLEKMVKAFVGRELRMIELKKIITDNETKIAKLENELNKPGASGLTQQYE